MDIKWAKASLFYAPPTLWIFFPTTNRLFPHWCMFSCSALKMSGLRSRLKWRRLLVVAAQCELRSRLMTLQNSPELLPLFVNKQEVKTCHLTWFSIGKSSTWLIIIFLLIPVWFSYNVRFILRSLNSSHSKGNWGQDLKFTILGIILNILW